MLACDTITRQVGYTEEQAREDAAAKGYELGKSVGHFRANSKALAEGEGDGIAKVYRSILYTPCTLNIVCSTVGTIVSISVVQLDRTVAEHQ
jgi:hypothetical protein